jgi:hypothetical protein
LFHEDISTIKKGGVYMPYGYGYGGYGGCNPCGGYGNSPYGGYPGAGYPGGINWLWVLIILGIAFFFFYRPLCNN